MTDPLVSLGHHGALLNLDVEALPDDVQLLLGSYITLGVVEL